MRHEKMTETSKRRGQILDVLKDSDYPISGTNLANMFNVSRQVIVQDIAILKAESHDIVSTHRGYKLFLSTKCSRILKVLHTDDDIERELNAVVDVGAVLKDVFVWHKAYGKIRIELNIKSRKDVQDLLLKMTSGVSRPLKRLTDGYHYHTIVADTEAILDEVEEQWAKTGFIVGE
ncbi:transcription repressor NadR [Streptococcus halichoeri]|uniref:transcription repressor NadR n=1 Tax=Streptococcus halichoeri TaxID=254785 RepID=UPI0019179AE3|nr:transcription repressor NadR [Streptococcus halichoeri]